MDRFKSYEEYLNFTISAPDEYFWDMSFTANTKQAFEEYLKNYPHGLHIEEAKSKIDEFIAIEKDNEAYNKAKSVNSKESYEEYLRVYPNGCNANEAQEQISNFIHNDHDSYNKAINVYTKQAFEEYLKSYPNGLHIEEAKRKIDELIKVKKEIEDRENAKREAKREEEKREIDNNAFAQAIKTNTEQAYKEYTTNYPNGLHIEEAKRKIDELIKVKKEIEDRENAKRKAKREEIVENYRYLRRNIDDPAHGKEDLIKIFFVFLFLLSLSFEYGDWWFLKGFGVMLIAVAAILGPLDESLKPMWSPEPSILKNSTEDKSTTKEIYDKYKIYDIFGESFILSKKTDNVFKTININLLEKHNHLIQESISNLNLFKIKYFTGGTILALFVVILMHMLSNHSVFKNNTSFVDATDPSNLIKPSKEVCSKFGVNTNEGCIATWKNARKICDNMSARLPTTDEYGSFAPAVEYSDASEQNIKTEAVRWTNTVSDLSVIYRIAEGTFGLIKYRNEPANPWSSPITSDGNEHGHDDVHLVECVAGQNDFYLNHFDSLR
jgi:hypothetical protein